MGIVLKRGFTNLFSQNYVLHLLWDVVKGITSPLKFFSCPFANFLEI